MVPDMNNASREELIAEIADLKKQIDISLEEIKSGKNTKLDPELYSDDFKELAISVNNTLDAISEQQERKIFYENILESIPIPICVMDLNENFIYINKKAENEKNIRREDVLGMQCSASGREICHTDKCGIKALRRGETETRFEEHKKHFTALLSYVYDSNGDAIGHLEAIVNVTELVWAIIYVKNVTTALLHNLDQCASGNFDLDTPLPPLYADHDNVLALHAIHTQFETIFEHLKIVTGTVREVLSDVKEMTVAMHEGRFDHRADTTIYKGEFEQAAEELNELLDFVLKPIHDTIRVCKSYAAGDFTARTHPDGMCEGEWGDYKNSVDKIGIDVSHQLIRIAQQMDELSLLTQYAGEDIKIGMDGTEQMLELAGQISASSSDGSTYIAQSVKVMEDVILSVAETATRSQQASVSASQANEYAIEGMEQTQRSGLVMEGITDSARVLEILIKDINGQMAEIGKIIKLISEISNQTNLLALNAAIEAARAGEAGRGFAVVASEVKALAQDSRRFAESITDMIFSLQEKAQKADQATNQVNGVVQQGKLAVDENLSILEKIVTSVGDIHKDSLEVAAIAQEQTAAVHDATMSIATVGDRINHSARQVEKISIVSQETGDAITKIGEVFNDIHSTTKQISGRIAEFKLSEDEPIIPQVKSDK